jgi:hypothetical protein
MAALASAESRILGSAQLGKLRDAAIGLLRVTTLLAAVLLIPFQNDSTTPTTPGGEGVSKSHVNVIPIRVPSNRDMDPGARPRDPVEINLNVDGLGTGESKTTVEIVEHKPVQMPVTGTLVMVGADYWYRSELGIGDYLWALPNGDFSMQLLDRPDCEGAQCALLEFQFDTRNTTRTHRDTVLLVGGGASDRADPAPVAGEGGVASCNDEGGNPRVLVCSYSGDGREVKVWVRASSILTDAPGKTAFDVKWTCMIGDRTCVAVESEQTDDEGS